MRKINNIVLNIPHSTDFMPVNNWNEDISKDVRKWTDWFTDELFPSIKEGVTSVIFPYSRFFCDAERLLDDPLNEVGQGIYYLNFNGKTREDNFFMKEGAVDLWKAHRRFLAHELTEESLLIDCHSFPSDLSDVDICIGYNEDWSKPDDEVISIIKDTFEGMGYKVGINNPYSNSITPIAMCHYQSVMIEINKKCYMSEPTIETSSGFYTIKYLLETIYRKLLK